MLTYDDIVYVCWDSPRNFRGMMKFGRFEAVGMVPKRTSSSFAL